VDGLSDLERTVISLRLNGLSVPEIAIALRMHTRKVRRTCQRAVQLLQKRLSRVAR
jgi:DNA-directed RNA polymerase specialized sigma24 family protein